MKKKLLEAFQKKNWAIEFKEINSLADFDETFKKSHQEKKNKEYSFIVAGHAKTRTTSLFIYGEAIGKPWFYSVDFQSRQKEINRDDSERWCKRIPFSQISETLISDEKWDGQRDSGIIILHVLKHLVEKKKMIDENCLLDFNIPPKREMDRFRQKWASEIGEEEWGVWEEWKEIIDETPLPPITENDLTLDEMNYALRFIDIPQEILA